MKTLLLFLLVCSTGFSQEFIATRAGLVSKKDITQDYVVLNFDGMSADTLYARTKKYIQKKYTGARDIINADDKNRIINIETANNTVKSIKKNDTEVLYLTDYKANFEIKEGRLKIAYTNIDIYTENADREKKKFPLESYWNAEGKLVDAETKKIVEDNFNASVKLIATDLKKENKPAKTGW